MAFGRGKGRGGKKGKKFPGCPSLCYQSIICARRPPSSAAILRQHPGPRDATEKHSRTPWEVWQRQWVQQAQMTERSCLPSQAHTHTHRKAQAKTWKRHIKTCKHVTPSQVIINSHYIKVYWRWCPCLFFIIITLILSRYNKNEMISVQFTK